MTESTIGGAGNTLLTITDGAANQIGTIRVNGVTNANMDITDFTLAVAGAVLPGATAANNTLNGTANNDTINALAGNDTVKRAVATIRLPAALTGRAGRGRTFSTATPVTTRSSGMPIRQRRHRSSIPMAATRSTAAPKALSAIPSSSTAMLPAKPIISIRWQRGTRWPETRSAALTAGRPRS